MIRSHAQIVVLLLICGLALLINVGSYGVVETSDARYAEIGREMFTSGDYIHPNLLDVHHYHKPPITYQLAAIGYKMFGINAFGARFFLQLAVLLQVLLVYALTFLLFENQKMALWAAMIYFSLPMVLISSRNLTTDAFLATFALLSIYCWVRYRKKNELVWLYATTISLALGFLTKGPVIFIVPVIFIIFYNRFEPSKRKLGIHHFLTWLVFLILAGSWFAVLLHQNPTFIDYFLGKQTVDRFSADAFNRTEPFWYFIAFGPVVALPWIFSLPILVKRKRISLKAPSIKSALVFAILIPLLFFSISHSKRILYILPFYSLFAIWIAQLWSEFPIEKTNVLKKYIFIFSLLLILGAMALIFIKIDFVIPFSFKVGSVFAFLLLVWLYMKKKSDRKTVVVAMPFVLGLFLLMGSTELMSANELKINSTKPISDFIKNKGLGNHTILVYNERLPSIAFGLNKSIISLYDGDRNLNRETQFEINDRWKNYLINLKTDEGVSHLKKKLVEPSVLIAEKGKLPEEKKWILRGFTHAKRIGKWDIYYVR